MDPTALPPLHPMSSSRSTLPDSCPMPTRSTLPVSKFQGSAFAVALRSCLALLAVVCGLLGNGTAWGQTAQTIPYSFNPGVANLTSANGWSQSGIGTDYSASASKVKFDTTGDVATLFIASAPNQVTFTLTGNSYSGGTFNLLESSNNSAYTTVKTYTTAIAANTSTVFTEQLLSTTRYIRWKYTTKSSGNVGFGTISISAPAGPAITTSGTLATVNTTYGTASATPTSFSVSGSSLTGNLTVTPPSRYEVSLSSGSGYTTSLTITASGTLSATTVYARLAAANAIGSYSGNIVVSGGGATSVNVATVSSSVGKATPTISVAPTATAITYGQTLASSALSGGTASVAGTFAFTTSSTAPSAGTASQGITFTPTDTTNYNTATGTADVLVNAKALTITASNVTKLLGATLTGGAGSTAFTSSGLVSPQTIGSVTISYGTGAASGAAVATYSGSVTPSAATGGTFTAANYSISYVAGDITVIPVPVISTTGNPSTFSGAFGIASTAQSFTAAGSDLTADITVTAPTGYEVSQTSDTTGFTSTQTLTRTSGVVASKTIYVRLSSSAALGTVSGNVALTSSNATTVNVAVTGTVSAANYYSKASGNLDELANWGTNTDGTGTAPTSFTLANQIFNVRNNAAPTIGAAWTVSGTSSKVVVGDGTNPCNFTIPSTFAVTAPVDVAANATVTNRNTSNPTFGTLAATSTVDYNGTGAQTVAAVTYGNVTISGTRVSTPAITLGSGTITVGGTFSVTQTGAVTYTKTGNTVTFASASSQTIPAINYNNLSTSNSGARVLASSGTIGIAGTFTTTGSTYTTTGSTVDYNGTGGTITTLAYNNLSVSGSGTYVFNASYTGSGSIAGNYSQTGSATVQAANSTAARTININGNFNLSNGTFALISASTHVGTTVNVTGSATISGTGAINMESTSSTSGAAIFAVTGDFTATSTSTSIVDFGTGTVTGNEFRIGGNFSKSGTGTFTTTSGSAATGFAFNKSGTQTFSHAGAISNFTQYVVNSGSVLVPSTAIPLGTNTNPASALTVNSGGIVDMGANSITTAGTGQLVTINGTLKTANLNGFSGAAASTITTTTPPTITLGASSTIDYTAAVGTQTVTGRTDYANLTLSGGSAKTLGGTTALSSTGVLTLTSGILATGANTLTLANNATTAIAGGSTTAFVNGPIRWTLPASLTASASVYSFPVGSGSTYLPLSLTTVTTSATAPVVQISATASNAGGTADGSTVTSLSDTEYWTQTVSGTSTSVSGSISVSRQTAASPFSLIAKSTTLAGTYSGIGGTDDGNSIINSSSTGTVSTGTSQYYVMAALAGLSTPPTLTAASSVSVDAPFAVTFTDDATWRAAITSITVGGTALASSSYDVTTAGQITFDPAQSALLQTPGAKAIVFSATNYTGANVSQSLAVGADNKLAITTQPTAPLTNGAVLAAQPVVAIRDQYNNATTSTVSITAAVGSGTWTLGGTSSVSGIDGAATFSGLTATSTTAVTGATITFTAAGLTSATSSTFNIAAPVPLITGTASAAAFTTTYGTQSSPQTFAVSGINLTANLVATAPTGFEVAFDGATYGATASITPTDFSASGTLSIRLAATAAVNATLYNSKNITLASTGATTRNISTTASGNTVSPKALTIAAPTIASKTYNATAVTGAVTPGALSGLVGSETLGVTATGVYADANAGTGKTATVTYTLANGTNGGLATNYSLAVGSGTGDIAKADQTITLASTLTKTTTDVDFSPATASSVLTVTYTSSNPNVATIVSGAVHIVGSGTSIITASQAGDTNYNAAPNVTSTLSVSATAYTENMGTTGSSTLVGSYTGWQRSSPVVYSSTEALTDVRTTTASTGYTGASGGCNVFLGIGTSTTRNFLISGINTSSYPSMTLSFGLLRDNATNGLTVEVSSDGTTYSPLTITQPASNNTWTLVTASGTIPSTSNLRVRFSKTGSTSFRIDDVSLSSVLGPVITASTASLTDFGSVPVASGSTEQSFTVSGNNTTADVIITAPTGFLVSKTSDSGFDASVTLAQSGGYLATTTVYAQFAPATAGSKSGNITVASTGATTRNIAVTGNAIKITPTISVAPTASDIVVGQTLASSILSGGTASVEGTFAFTTSATAPGVGTASQSVTFTPTDTENYNSTTTTASVTVLSLYASWASGFPSFTETASGSDPDNDQISNLLEYAFGTNPAVSSAGPLTYANGVITSNGQPTTSVTNITDGVDFRAVFGRRKDYVNAGLTYTVQFSAGMDVWVDSTDTPEVLASDAMMDAVSVPYPFFIITSRGVEKPTFFRVAVSSN